VRDTRVARVDSEEHGSGQEDESVESGQPQPAPRKRRESAAAITRSGAPIPNRTGVDPYPAPTPRADPRIRLSLGNRPTWHALAHGSVQAEAWYESVSRGRGGRIR
jgi:hypothetical protein